MPKSNIDQRLLDLLERTKTALGKPSQLLKEVHNVPMAIAIAFQTQRPQLVRASVPNSLTSEQIIGLYDFVATLIETNHALQQHAHQVASLTEMWIENHKGMAKAASRITEFASFGIMHENKEEDED